MSSHARAQGPAATTSQVKCHAYPVVCDTVCAVFPVPSPPVRFNETIARGSIYWQEMYS